MLDHFRPKIFRYNQTEVLIDNQKYIWQLAYRSTLLSRMHDNDVSSTKRNRHTVTSSGWANLGIQNSKATRKKHYDWKIVV